MTINLKYHGLGFHVLNKGPGDGYGYILYVVEVQGGAFPSIFQGFGGECFIMSVYKTRIKM